MVSGLGIIELTHGQWENLIPTLVGNMAGNSLVLKEGTLATLGILCEEIVGIFMFYNGLGNVLIVGLA